MKIDGKLQQKGEYSKKKHSNSFSDKVQVLRN